MDECEFYCKDTGGCKLGDCVSYGCKTITNTRCKYNTNCYFKVIQKQKDLLTLYEQKIKQAQKRFEKLRYKFCISTSYEAKGFVDEAIKELKIENK